MARPDEKPLTPGWAAAPAVRAVASRADLPAFIAAFVMLVALCFAVFPDGFQWNVYGMEVDAVGGSTVRRLQWLPLFLLAAYVVWRRRALAWALARDINPLLIALVAYATLTVLWSPVPGVTMRKLAVLYGLFLIGISFHVAGWHPDRYAKMLRVALTLMLAISLFLAVAVPRIGLEQQGPSAGFWRGAAGSKNLLAGLAAAGALVWMHALAARRAPVGRCAAGLALAFVLLLMSRGKTGLITAVVALPLVWILVRPPVRTPHLLPMALVAGLACVVVTAYVVLLSFGGVPNWYDVTTPVALAVGKDPSLTARDQLWMLMWEHIRQHWILGYGFDSFWLGNRGPSGEIVEELYWRPWQAHNGYIDVLNETGIVGLGLTVGFLLVHFFQIWRLALFDAVNASLHLALAVMILLSNIAETSLLSGLSFYWLLLLFSSISVTRALSPHLARLAGVREDSGLWRDSAGNGAVRGGTARG